MSLASKSLTLIVASAFVALTATASASAADYTAGQYPASISAVHTSEMVWSNGIRSVTCTGISETGTLSAASTSLTVTPSYTGCTGNGSTTATINTNGCNFKYTIIEMINATEAKATTSVVCPAGKEIQIDIWATGKSHSEGKLCQLGMPSQGPFLVFVLVVVAVWWAIETKKNMTTLLYKRVMGTSINCGAAETTKGTVSGDTLASAKNGLGESVNHWFD